MSIKELQTEFSRSFYLVITLFVKVLLFVQVPFTKKKLSNQAPAPTKSEQDLPPPLLKKPKSKFSWQEIISIRQQNGIKTKPIKHRVNVLQSYKCPDCYAPIEYVYANGSSYMCSLCGRQVQKKTRKIRPNKYLTLYCPFCHCNLVWKKERSFFIVYKCINPNCDYKLKHKLRYTWRLFIVGDKLPFQNAPESVKLTEAHSPMHIVATAIYFGINIALASTTVCGVLKTIFGINVSHKTIDNWKYAAATLLYNFFFTSKIQLPKTIVIDETYLSILGKTYYLYAALAPNTRQILAFFISNKRNGNSAFNLLQLLVSRVVDKTVKCRIVTDGAHFYPPAIACANLILGTKFSHDVIIGLKDVHPRRTFKNMIERLWSTFHASYKNHHGLKDFQATIAHAVLFFSYYNFFRPHLSLDDSVPVVIDNINPDDNAIKNWLLLLSQASCSSPPKTYLPQIQT